jgi:hypothetical protein
MQVAVVEVMKPRIEIVMEPPTDSACAMSAPPRRPGGEAKQPGEANATAALMSLWASTLLLKDILKDETEAEENRKLKVQHGKCDCC